MTAWEMVTCQQCGRHYRCTPEDDFYTRAADGMKVCTKCLVGELPVHTLHADEIEISK